MNVPIKLSDQLSDKKKIEILRKNWMSHDAKYQMTIVQRFGWEEANKLNKQIITEMGKTMMFRLKNALSIEDIRSPEEFMDICSAAVDFYYPSPIMLYEFKKNTDMQLLAVIKKCAVIDQIKSIGVTEFYECGCFAMRQGWYKALGLRVKEECLTCLKEGDKECNILVNVKRWKE